MSKIVRLVASWIIINVICIVAESFLHPHLVKKYTRNGEINDKMLLADMSQYRGCDACDEPTTITPTNLVIALRRKGRCLRRIESRLRRFTVASG